MPRSDPNAGAPKRVVYTALIGQYEALNAQPAAVDSSVDFICFTDDPDATSDTWTIRLIEPRFPLDAIRSARYLKIKGPTLLDGYDESLWIDNTVQLKGDPNALFEQWLAEHDLAMPLHSYRQSVIGEFDAVITAGYDDPARVYEQLIHYSTLTPDLLGETPYWTALLARRHTPAVAVAMDLWFDHVLRYSRRDQLSINAALLHSQLPVSGITLDNWDSPFHRWPLRVERKWSRTEDRLAGALRPPIADVGRLENQVVEMHEMLNRVTVDRQKAEMLVADYEAAFSWRVTRPLRVIAAKFRRKR